jgi:polyisoprenoid-binding protein YceI
MSVRREELVIRNLFMLMLVGAELLGNVALAGSNLPLPFRIDPFESRVWFDAEAPLHSFRGQTQDVTGAFTLQQSSPLQIAEAKVTINAASLETGNSDRDADMRNDFLEVKKFPTIELTAVELLTARPAANEPRWDVVLQGRLTVHGTTRDVKVPTTVHLAAERITARGQILLDMRDYNIRVPRLLLIPMKSEVLVGFEMVARPVR